MRWLILVALLLLAGCSFHWDDGGGQDVKMGMGGCASNPCQPEVPDGNAAP